MFMNRIPLSPRGRYSSLVLGREICLVSIPHPGLSTTRLAQGLPGSLPAAVGRNTRNSLIASCSGPLRPRVSRKVFSTVLTRCRPYNVGKTTRFRLEPVLSSVHAVPTAGQGSVAYD